jgi:23S rRNA pseudouridine1911/1915/1917 synthase
MMTENRSLNDGWIYRDKIDRSGVGQTILQYYAQRYTHSSLKEWETRLTLGQIWLDGKPLQVNTPLQLGQLLEYHRPSWLEPHVPLNFATIYEDEDLLVIDKPSGLPVMPGGNFLQNTLLWQLQQQYSIDPPIPVHRLGRGTSGLLLLGKSALAKSELSRQMRSNHIIKKIYLALVADNTIPDRLIIDNSIGKISHPILGYVYGATPTGKYAYSEVEVIQRNIDRAIVRVKIITGRPHQIRIHLAVAGYPLLGDPLYQIGGLPKIDAVPGDCGYWLHSHQLSFLHPRTNDRLHLECPAFRAEFNN